MTKLVAIILLSIVIDPPGFKDQQLQFGRVKSAYEEKELAVKNLLSAQNIGANYELFIRAFKKEEELEVWAKQKDASSFSLIVTYNFCTSSGKLGPKRKKGDLQIPEGVYNINHFNPYSTFHLSLGINYPNASDRILGNKTQPGGDIYIHGDCVTIGCIPITDEKIKELYILAVESRNNGQSKIQVHIFPARMDSFDEPMTSFWENLKTIYNDFETTKKLRPVTIDKAGAYTF